MSMTGLKKYLDELAGPDHPFVKQLEEMTSFEVPNRTIDRIRKKQEAPKVKAKVLRLNKN